MKIKANMEGLFLGIKSTPWKDKTTGKELMRNKMFLLMDLESQPINIPDDKYDEVKKLKPNTAIVVKVEIGSLDTPGLYVRFIKILG